MVESDNLGKVSAWQIREFPEALREDVIRQAKAEKVSVGEFVTAHMVALRDAGWPRGGVPNVSPNIPSNGLQTVNPSADLPTLMNAAAALAAATRGSLAVVGGLEMLLKEMVRRERGLPPTKAQMARVLAGKAPANLLGVDGNSGGKPPLLPDGLDHQTPSMMEFDGTGEV